MSVLTATAIFARPEDPCGAQAVFPASCCAGCDCGWAHTWCSNHASEFYVLPSAIQQQQCRDGSGIVPCRKSLRCWPARFHNVRLQYHSAYSSMHDALWALCFASTPDASVSTSPGILPNAAGDEPDESQQHQPTKPRRIRSAINKLWNHERNRRGAGGLHF